MSNNSGLSFPLSGWRFSQLAISRVMRIMRMVDAWAFIQMCLQQLEDNNLAFEDRKLLRDKMKYVVRRIAVFKLLFVLLSPIPVVMLIAIGVPESLALALLVVVFGMWAASSVTFLFAVEFVTHSIESQTSWDSRAIWLLRNSDRITIVVVLLLAAAALL